MENLPQKTENTFLEIRKPGIKAIDKRREVAKIPEVFEKLSNIEKIIFRASTKAVISEVEDSVLINQLNGVFKFIALDVGFRIPTDQTEWQMIKTRLFKFLKMYHGNLTVEEISLAFELVATGALDEYCPKDKEGFPDKSFFNHYQQFNIEYFTKVLKAYKSKQNEVEFKALESVPKPLFLPDPTVLNHQHNKTVDACKEAFESYKENRELKLDGLKSMFVWEWLKSLNFVKDPIITEDHKKEALDSFLQKSIDGLVNRYTAAIVRNEGIESKEISYPALELARMEKIKKTFDAMIERGVDVNKYLNYKS